MRRSFGAGCSWQRFKRLWNRVAQLYVAHIMLFLIFTAQIARTARRLDNPLYENELNVFNFLQHPDVLIGQALTLAIQAGQSRRGWPLYITLVFAAAIHRVVPRAPPET